MSGLRILVLAPESNPESHQPVRWYYQAEALARLHEVTLVFTPQTKRQCVGPGARFMR